MPSLDSAPTNKHDSQVARTRAVARVGVALISGVTAIVVASLRGLPWQ
jgi:hypothetical protein